MIVLVASLLSGCSKSEKSQPEASTESAANPASAASPENAASVPAPVSPVIVPADRSPSGAIAGTVSFKGAAPKFPLLDMSQDPGCPPDRQPPEVVVVNGGKLVNVFVYVKSGLSQASYAPPVAPAVLDQQGCRYVPRVLGLMAGQPLKVLNDDTAEHNVHPMTRNNDEWNESQMPRGQPIIKTFHHPEMAIPVQCNQHPWMKAYLNVMAHPFFAVSAGDGTFQIGNLPPGEYTLAALHEKFGERTMKIKVGPGQTATASFTFTAGSK